MKRIKELALLVGQLEEQLVVCIRCGMCQAVCPLFEQTGREADVARGKLALLSALMTRQFQDVDGVIKRLNKCLLCGSCAANCPSGVRVLEIFIRARAILTEYKGLPPLKKIVFRGMLSKPEKFDTMTALAQKFQNLVIKSSKTPQGTSCSRFALTALRHFKAIAKEPFRVSISAKRSYTGYSGIRVVLFTGCLIDKFMPEIAHASVKALDYHQVDIMIPESQGCCGIPALAAGDRKTFDVLLGHHADLFQQKDFDYLVTACATCASTIKKFWPSLYRGNDSGTRHFFSQLSEKTMDISQFLVDVIPEGPRKARLAPMLQKSVTYHDPCHLKKSLGIFTQPRKLIESSGHRLAEMEGADKCCGMGGSFNLFHYNISSEIGTLKKESIEKTNCSIAASGCPACILQITDMLSKAGSPILVKHPVELYADTLPDLRVQDE